MGFPNSSQWTMAPVAEAKGFRDGPRGRNSSPRLCNVARCMKQCFLRSTCIRNVRSVNDSRASLFACPRKTSVTETRSNRLTFSSFASCISSNVAVLFVDRFEDGECQISLRNELRRFASLITLVRVNTPYEKFETVWRRPFVFLLV